MNRHKYSRKARRLAHQREQARKKAEAIAKCTYKSNKVSPDCMAEQGYVANGHGGWRPIHKRQEAKKKKKEEKQKAKLGKDK